MPLTRRQALAALPFLALAGTGFPAGPRAETLPPPRLGGPFRMTTHRGEVLTEKDLEGAPYVLFFGFTHCPEICPTTLWEISEDLEFLGPKAASLNVFFVSVDPERDTQETLQSYAEAFGNRVVALYGTPEETARIARNYKAVFRKVPTSDGDYTMEHTALLYLVDAGGNLFDTVRYQEDPDVRRRKLEELASKGD
ncbi:SCO family protein [Rhizobiaceae bacterium BDR2-2]|uniref:SCO family protein n=1 Tax=Ectorhizobium quercum TaxID=2965071 RepID=A0AAE3SY72_9HYPH|nr:SCO family protein [Ectorhizobium quercum]MCX8999864.1 SCO family protein [Ectorhizobium quercum]